MASGPLAGVKIVEFAGIGPGPFAGMLLSDMGADVVRIDRASGGMQADGDVTARGRRSIALDLKDPASIDICLQLLDKADGLIEGFRPGVMERLGLGPEVALSRNPRLVYGRMTGWGQTGPLAQAAGHDINYIAITGALHAIGPKDKPAPPLNLLGDFGGGSLYLALGILAGIIHARTSGQGQIVDAAVCDGATNLMTMFYGFLSTGYWTDQRASNLIDGGAHFYDTFECADGKFVSIGPIEPHFFKILLEKAGIGDAEMLARQRDRPNWPEDRKLLDRAFRSRTRDEWAAMIEGSDACFAPVLDLHEAPLHPHNLARDSFVEVGGIRQPAPAPRFSLTPGAVQGPPPGIGAHRTEVFREWDIKG